MAGHRAQWGLATRLPLPSAPTEAVEEDDLVTEMQDPLSKLEIARPSSQQLHPSHQSLLDDIENSLQTYMRTSKKPHYSLEQLAVIAVAFTNCATWKQAFIWIMKHIPYVNERAVVEFADENWVRHTLRHRFRAAYEGAELPLIWQSNADGTHQYSISSASARPFLGLHGREQPETPFRFFDLPAEIRDMIYSLVFAVPGGQICLTSSQLSTRSSYSRDGSGPRLHGLLRVPRSARTAVRSWMSDLDSLAPSNKKFRAGPLLSQHLASLRVSKQFHSEAMPVFYKQTQFMCPSVELLNELLVRSGPVDTGRLPIIRHLAFFLNPKKGRNASSVLSTSFAACFDALKSMKGLRSLDIHLNEHEWSDVNTARGQPKWPDLLKIPAVMKLSQLRGTLTSNRVV